MRTTLAITASSLPLPTAHPPQSATTYAVDPVHSVVEFGVSHMVISTVRGKFTPFPGTITCGADAPSPRAIRGKGDAEEEGR